MLLETAIVLLEVINCPNKGLFHEHLRKFRGNQRELNYSKEEETKELARCKVSNCVE